MLHELVLIHGKSSNRKAANLKLSQFNITLQIYTVSPAEMEETHHRESNTVT